MVESIESSALANRSDRAHVAAELRSLHDMSVVRDGPHVVAALVHVAAIAACIATWQAGWWSATVLLWLLLAWLDHAALVRLHESVHSMLSRSRWRNEAWGLVVGILSLTPPSVYRYVHNRHHAYLGGERDPEFWPYNLPGTPRWRRLAYASAELALGMIVTPALYSWRTWKAWPSHRPALRRRLVLEWLATGVFWTALVALMIPTGWWPLLIVGHVVPAWLAGVGQTLRKFTEHLGREGTDIPAMTRTVVYRGFWGRLASKSQLHVDHHGTHHRWPRIPGRNLPAATELLLATFPARPFSSHFAAVRDVLRHLADPTVGPQWRVSG